MTWSHPGFALTPDAALVLVTLGLLLIYLELNRPGMVLPGALGILLSLLGLDWLLRAPLRVTGVVLVATAAVLLVVGLFRPMPTMASAAATLALGLGFDQLVAGRGAQPVHALTAAICGAIIGAATSILTRVAYRARANKAVD